jgi:hypothetical protein
MSIDGRYFVFDVTVDRLTRASAATSSSRPRAASTDSDT